jgi:hypothetical protein
VNHLLAGTTNHGACFVAVAGRLVERSHVMPEFSRAYRSRINASRFIKALREALLLFVARHVEEELETLVP